MLFTLYHWFIYDPIYNLLVAIYDSIAFQDLGVAIIILTVIIRLALYKPNKSAIEAQKSMAELQPKMKELKKKYKNDQQKQSQEMLKLYRTHKINPLGSCLPLLVQFPFLIAVYRVLRSGLEQVNGDLLYHFTPNPGFMDPVAFGFLNLGETNFVLPLLAATAQFFQARMMPMAMPPKQVEKDKGAQDEDVSTIMNRQMKVMMPLITFFIGISLPAGLSLYWFVSTLATIVQQRFIMKRGKGADEQNGTKKVIEGEGTVK
jgi:YidC/Oxa1 family membrane protein insertase